MSKFLFHRRLIKRGRPDREEERPGQQFPRVTFTIASMGAGGAQRVMSIMANYWTDHGWSVSIATLDNPQELPFYDLRPVVAYQPLDGVRYSRNRLRALVNNRARLLALRRAIRRSRPDVVISFGDTMNVLTLLAAVWLKVPVIVSERVDPHEYSIGRTWTKLRNLVYRRAARITVQSERAAHYFSPPVRKLCRVVPNPAMPIQGLNGTTDAPRSSDPLLIAMGRLTEQKGFDLLLRAFALVAREYPQWHVCIWGEGPLRPRLEALRDELGLRDRVYLPGTTREPFEQMRRSRLFVLSSRYEGFPNVLVEAMGCGLPAISFDCPSGPREIIRDGVDGVLVPPDDVDALAAAMHRLMGSAEERQRLAERAPDVLERFGLERVMSMWERLVLEVVR